jgi:hypothetical protein
MKNKGFLIMLCVILCVFVSTSCDNKEPSNKDNQFLSSNDGKNNNQILTSKDGSLQIEVPKDWISDPYHIIAVCEIKCTNKEGDFNLIVNIEKKDYLKDLDIDVNDLQQYVDICVGSLEGKTFIDNIIISPQVNTSVGGYPAIQVEYSCRVTSSDYYVYWMYFFKRKAVLYKSLGIVNWTKNRTTSL